MLARWRLHIGRLWQIGMEPQAGAARASVLWHAGTYRVGAVPADEPPVLVGDHRSELNANDAIRAADGQGCVGQSWYLAFLHHSKKGWQAGFQTPRPVIPLKNQGSLGATRLSSRNPRQDFGKRADRRADEAGLTEAPRLLHASWFVASSASIISSCVRHSIFWPDSALTALASFSHSSEVTMPTLRASIKEMAAFRTADLVFGTRLVTTVV